MQSSFRSFPAMNMTSVLLCAVLTFTLMFASSSVQAQERSNEGSGCSPAQLSKISTRYMKRLYDRFGEIRYLNNGLKIWEIKLANFKRRLLLSLDLLPPKTKWGFRRLDSNNNHLIDNGEGVRKGRHLPGSTECNVAYLKQCDKDQSKTVSRQEWLDCFKIPACEKTCPGARLDEIQCVCRCTELVIQGRVVSFLGSPLREASIASLQAPTTQLASTNSSGHFRLSEKCGGAKRSYKVNKNGYIPVLLESAIKRENPFLLIQLDDAEPASITVNPKGKIRLRRQGANFTCKAEGTDPITIYWYKNGGTLLKTSVGRNSSLTIPDVSGAQGFYSCKAVNDYGSEISTPAELSIVEDSVEDTCNSTPSKNILHLPSTCKVLGKNQNTLDIGRCTNGPCSNGGPRTDGKITGCGADEGCCCGPVETLPAAIRCGRLDLEMERVTRCGCTKCVIKKTLIKGVVVGGPNQHPVSGIRVMWKNLALATSSKEGAFSIIVPDELERLTVTFQDLTDRYFDTTMTLPFQKGQSVFHLVTLQLEDPPIEFDSTQELKVPVGHTGESMAELELPADNLLHKNGTPFRGKAKLRVSVTDPRNVTDLLSAPGDFTTVDQSGNVQPLKTYGILRIKLEDENSEQLALADNLNLFLDADMIKLPRNSTGEMAPKLWWLDEKTGRWRDMGEMKPAQRSTSRDKRQASSGRRFYIGQIQTDRISVVNIDIAWRRCYVRAQALAKSKDGVEPLEGAQITLIGSEDDDQEQYYGYTQAITNQDGVACVPAWCDSTVYLQAAKRNLDLTAANTLKRRSLNYLLPDSDAIQTFPSDMQADIVEGNETKSFRFKALASSSMGPIFSGDELGKCFSTDDDLKALTFYGQKGTEPEEKEEFGSQPLGHPLSWYTLEDFKATEKQVKKCFVKVKTENNNEAKSAPMISAESYTPDRKQRYGFSIKQQTRLSENASWAFWAYSRFHVYATCLEYRCSEPGKETFIRLSTLDDICYRIELGNDVIEAQPEGWNVTRNYMEGWQTTSFYAPTDVSDGKFGFYTGVGETAEENCRRGDVPGGDVQEKSDAEMKSDGYAVFVVDPLECPWEWFESWNLNDTESEVSP